jgi:hypothetical protein
LPAGPVRSTGQNEPAGETPALRFDFAGGCKK